MLTTSSRPPGFTDRRSKDFGAVREGKPNQKSYKNGRGKKKMTAEGNQVKESKEDMRGGSLEIFFWKNLKGNKIKN